MRSVIYDISELLCYTARKTVLEKEIVESVVSHAITAALGIDNSGYEFARKILLSYLPEDLTDEVIDELCSNYGEHLHDCIFNAHTSINHEVSYSFTGSTLTVFFKPSNKQKELEYKLSIENGDFIPVKQRLTNG